MICDEAKVLIGGDPATVGVALHDHLRGCGDCLKFRAQMLEFEMQLRRALECEVFFGTVGPLSRNSVGARAIAAGPRTLRQRFLRRRWQSRKWSLGVGLAAAVLAGFSLWVSLPQQALASEVIHHIEGEPDSWSQTQPVSVAALDAILHQSGLGVVRTRTMPGFVYARSCDFQGHKVPHLVVATRYGPVSVMIVTQVSVRAPKHFELDGYRGLLVPVRGGSVAVVSRTDIALEEPAREVLQMLDAGSPGLGAASFTKDPLRDGSAS